MAEQVLTLRKGQGGFTSEASNRSGVTFAKLPRAQVVRDADTTSDLESAGTVSVQGTNRLSIELLLERPESGSVALGGGTFVVPASKRPTHVTVVPTMTGKAGAPTEEYTATVRRRKIGAMARLFGELATLSTDDRFLFSVDATIKKIEEALQEFADSKREGNTREILRTLLNTLRNGRWERFKQSVVPEKVQKFLTQLATAEWIIPEQVEEFHSMVDDLELDSLTLPAVQWPE